MHGFLCEGAGLWKFPDERPLDREEVVESLKDCEKVLFEKTLWPLIFTQRHDGRTETVKTAVSFPSLWITLILLSGISGYGFWSESLFEQETWSPVGLDRLAQVGTVYMLAAVAVYFWKPFFRDPTLPSVSSPL